MGLARRITAHRITVVAADRDVRTTLGSWFEASGYQVLPASSFAEGRAQIATHPDLVVAELKLGEYNGLHIAAHAGSLGIPAIVIGPGDLDLERDAEQLGALYLSSVRQQDLLEIVQHELTDHEEPLCRFFTDRRRTMHSWAGRSILAN
jgi:DNA-binding NtrC family response regulator